MRFRHGDLEIELHASAFAPGGTVDGPQAADADKCLCGHSVTVEHNESGCLHGCHANLCSRTGTPEALA